MTDKGHLDPNPVPVTKQDVVQLLKDIVDGKL
jgi:succinate semialdehyde reductase